MIAMFFQFFFSFEAYRHEIQFAGNKIIGNDYKMSLFCIDNKLCKYYTLCVFVYMCECSVSFHNAIVKNYERYSIFYTNEYVTCYINKIFYIGAIQNCRYIWRIYT